MSLEVERERTVQALCSQFAHDRLTLEEVERRLELAQRARSDTELRALLADLPGGAMVPATPSGELALFSLAAPGEAPSEQRLLALLSEVKRRGPWTPARRQRVSAILGDAKLDFREALLQPGVTEVECNAILGAITITVPPGVRVECDGNAILGSFGEVGAPPPPRHPPPP
jgi:hypothetical protein